MPLDNDLIFRYIAIMKPLHYQQVMSVQVFTIMSATIWTSAVLVGFILPIAWHENWASNPLQKCDFVLVMKFEYLNYFIGPLVIMFVTSVIFMYIRIFGVVYKQSKKKDKVAPMAQDNCDTKSIRAKLKTQKTCAMILGAFILCWAPFVIITGIQIYGGHQHDEVLAEVRTLFTMLAFFNSGMNPVIYAYRIVVYRNEMKRLLLCMKPKCAGWCQ